MYYVKNLIACNNMNYATKNFLTPYNGVNFFISCLLMSIGDKLQLIMLSNQQVNLTFRYCYLLYADITVWFWISFKDNVPLCRQYRATEKIYLSNFERRHTEMWIHPHSQIGIRSLSYANFHHLPKGSYGRNWLGTIPICQPRSKCMYSKNKADNIDFSKFPYLNHLLMHYPLIC